MGRDSGGRASRERAPVSAYQILAIGATASLAFTLLIWQLGQRLADIPMPPIRVRPGTTGSCSIRPRPAA